MMKDKKSFSKLLKEEKIKLKNFFNTFNAWELMTEKEREVKKKEYYERGGWKLL